MTGEKHRRRARSSITPVEILDAAEQVALDDAGNVTVRAVAAILGSAPMALYRYFPTKDDLVNGLLNRVLGRFETPVQTDDWLADIGAFARSHRRLLANHQWAITALFANPHPGGNAVRIGETALALLRRGGIEGEPAVATFSGILALNYGWSAFVAGRRGRDLSFSDDQSSFERSSPAHPISSSLHESINQYGSESHYEIALSQLLAGIGALRPTP